MKRGNYMKTKMIKDIVLITTLLTLTGCNKDSDEKELKKAINATMQVEGYEWGPAVNKIIFEFEDDVTSFTKDSFNLDTRTDKRNILDVYNSDERGNRSDKESKYLSLELSVKANEGSPFGASTETGMNAYNDSYKITLGLNKGKEFKVGNTTYNDKNPFRFIKNIAGNRIVPSTDVFDKDSFTKGDITLQRALFTPKDASKDSSKNPLIIWLHGMGEGGRDIDVSLLGNEVTALTRDEIQSYFTTESQKGAYVLAVQTPTMWMDQGDKSVSYQGSLEKGQPSIYTDTLFDAIDDIVKNNADIDTDRIYLGGCSNGGYMTMNMLFNYRDYFAAYYPVCEAYSNANISDEKIDYIKDQNIYFIQSEDDSTCDPYLFAKPTFYRLIDKGASNIHYSLFDHVIGSDDKGHKYNGHWSWIYLFNNQVEKEFDNEKVKEDFKNITIENGVLTSKDNYVTSTNCTVDNSFFPWLASQHK